MAVWTGVQAVLTYAWLQSCYVNMRDGVELACDVLLPPQPSPSGKHTAVFFQTR